MNLFMSIDRCAEEAGISRRHFIRLMMRAKLRIVAIGRRHFLMREDFERWMKRRK